VLPQFCEEELGQRGKLCLRIAVRSRWVPIDRTEITLTDHETLAHDKVLGQPDQGFIRSGTAVWMVVTSHITDNLGTLSRSAITMQMKLMVHRVQDAPLYRLQAVAHVGQGS